MRIFISSTCYDLVDLRAELETFFKNAGMEPVLSDSLTSDFQVSPDANSIETCLANVRTCDQFIIILSNRYGPTLGKAGHVDVSATHLEYLEAKRQEFQFTCMCVTGWMQTSRFGKPTLTRPT